VFDCQMYNNDVLTDFKKPLFPKKMLERTTGDRGIIRCQTTLQTIPRVRMGQMGIIHSLSSSW
jgi:hypothetical protein